MYLILNLLITVHVSLAFEAPYPKNWCSSGMCSKPQEKIWNEFNEGLAPSWESFPKVVSGSCYHSSANYDNEVEHFSGFIIDVEDDGFSFNGRHSFFVYKNPYKDFDLKTAREEFKKGSLNRIDIFKDYGFYNANPGIERPVRYWFKEGSDGNLKLAVIFGTLRHFILCDLAHHKS